MTAHMHEVHVRKDGMMWKVEMFGPGTPPPDRPLWTERRWLKYMAVRVARGEARNLGSPVELYVHNRRNAIVERDSYPRASDPRGRG